MRSGNDGVFNTEPQSLGVVLRKAVFTSIE